MASRYCKYCGAENDDCGQKCAGWTDTAELRNRLQVKEVELSTLRSERDRARRWIAGDRGVINPVLDGSPVFQARHPDPDDASYSDFETIWCENCQENKPKLPCWDAGHRVGMKKL